MFARDYFEARDRFKHLAQSHTTLELDVRAAGRQSVGIDIAWLGAVDAPHIVLVTSGLHGVEGFVGSAIQCAVLAQAPAIAPNCALVLAHALNPWGFAQLRRVNENNVDLNRNLLRAGEQYAGAPALYARLDRLLNPTSPPRPDAFALRAMSHAVRYGLASCRQAIATGQYEYARGLFFGGRGLEPGPLQFLEWAVTALHGERRVLALDLHSGLGPFAAQSLFAAPNVPEQRVEALGALLQTRVLGGAGAADPAGFEARGSLSWKLREALPQAQMDFMTVEYGTYSGMRVLHALREENRWHHYGAGTLGHPSKQRLRRVFAPDSDAWRAAVVAAGLRLVRTAVLIAGRS